MSTDIAKVKKVLNAIASEVQSDIHYINNGGCAVYAVELAKRLDAIGFSDYKIRTYGCGGRNVNVATVEKKVFNTNLPTKTSEWNANDVYFSHVRLEWRGMVWDAEGAVNSRKARVWEMFYVRQKGHISRKAMEMLTKLQSNWNRMFDRRQVPKLKRIMDKHFASLEHCIAV